MNQITGISSGRLWQLAALNAAAGLFLVVSFGLTGIARPSAAGCTVQIIDFHVFWSAARLALAGTPLAVFDQETLRASFNACSDSWLPWLHPAPALALMTPFGLMPLIPAWFLFNGISLVAFALAVQPFASGPWVLAFLWSPAILPALLAGQFTVLWIAGFLAAMHALRQSHWVIAGILIGCLTLKPTLGVLIPVALIAIGAWRTILTAIVTTVILHGVASLAYGTDYWSNLWQLYQTHSAGVAEHPGALNTMTSLTAFLNWLGLPVGVALAANICLALVAACAVFLTWRRYGPSADVAIAIMAASIPLASPYLWHYDSAFLAITALFLLRQTGWRPGLGTAVSALLFWLGAGLSLWLAATNLSNALPPLVVVPPLFLLAFVASLYHSHASEQEGR